MLSQRFILMPEVEINIHGRDDPTLAIGATLSTVEAGLRLRYEIRREFSPYFGVNWQKLYGQSADYAREEGEDVDKLQFVIGVRAWF